jgi:Zn-dependent protease with chaperone function
VDPLSAARAVLPAWLPFFSLLAAPLGFLAGWMAARGLTAVAFRRAFAARDAHWTERARLAWPARAVTGFGAAVLPAVFGALLSNLGGPLALLGRSAAGLVAGVAALAGYALGTWPAARRLHGARASSRGRFLAGTAALFLVRAPHLVVTAVVAALMPPRFTGHGAEAALLLAVGTLLVFAAAFGGALGVGRVLGLIRPGGERLRRAAASAAAHEGVPAPGTAEMTCHLPVAFAIPLRRKLVFSDEALALFDDDELAAVAAHEIGHLTESLSVTLQRVGVLLFFTLLMAAPSLAGEGGRGAFLAVLFCLLALVAIGAFSRRTAREMEVRADAHAAAHEDAPGVYARALEKLHEAALVPAVLGRKGATHPDLWDRMTAAGSPPAWPKPERPGRGRAERAALALVAALLLVAGLAAQSVLVGALARRQPLAAVALTGGDAWPLSELARARAAGSRADDAVPLYRAAFTLDGRPGHLANAAFVASRAGRCDAARALAEEAAGALRSRPRAGAWDTHLVARAADVARRCERSAAGGGDRGD